MVDEVAPAQDVGAAPETEAAPAPETETALVPNTPFGATGAAPEAADAAGGEGDDEAEAAEPERNSVMYSCLRCSTPTPAEELDRLPEIKCICGFRVFVKNRPPVVKSIRAL